MVRKAAYMFTLLLRVILGPAAIRLRDGVERRMRRDFLKESVDHQHTKYVRACRPRRRVIE